MLFTSVFVALCSLGPYYPTLSSKPIQSSVGRYALAYFKVKVPDGFNSSSVSIVVQFERFSQYDYTSVYLRQGSLPTHSVYNASAYLGYSGASTTSLSFTMKLSALRDNGAFVGVYSYYGVSFNIAVRSRNVHVE